MDQLKSFQNDITTKFQDFQKKSPAIEVGVVTLGGATQGAFLGGMMGAMSNIKPPEGAAPMPPQPLTMQGGPWVLGRNFAVMTGVNAGLAVAIKHYRGGVEDYKGSMGASFGAGMCFTLVSNLGAKAAPAILGAPAPATGVALLADAVRTGFFFALIQGAFYKIGDHFSNNNKEVDTQYIATTEMLAALDLSKYEKNFKKGQLTDRTLPLLTESALAEVRIPPGPRLLILNQVSVMRSQLSALQTYKDKKPKGNQAVGVLSLAIPISYQ
ncbi:hypothetical protein CYMTET_26012 [Cymbomonas tetramitiformis]|uniref:SAM domain-containing protein n=1 Tax=Cymbomonas tetramitiformis TaxID=36881 RepID=A0AAE0KYC9_9CHLO|nr:hypothetical protein CYMTET_26012 [Cymbomonas tetramitiformis]